MSMAIAFSCVAAGVVETMFPVGVEMAWVLDSAGQKQANEMYRALSL